jgi:CrcB protein
VTQSDTGQTVEGGELDGVHGPAAEARPFSAAPEPRRQARHSPRVLAAIAVGGFAGGLARYGLGLAFPPGRGTFPAATFAVNVAGSFVLALLMVCVLEIWPPTRYIRPLLGTGFCGALTTFSTMTVGADQLIAEGHGGTAAAYLAGSLVAGLAAAGLGLSVGRSALAVKRRRAGRGERRAERTGPAPSRLR